MKLVAGRPVDTIDVRRILLSHPDLDLQRIRTYAAEFAALLENDEMVGDFERFVREVLGPDR